MSDQLDYWDVRLHNWALYFLGGASLAGRSSLCLLACSSSHWAETREIALIGEAVDTDDLVQQLRPEQIKTVTAYYAWSGTKEMIAQQLRIADRTLRWRVQDAKEDLGVLQAEARRSIPKINKVTEIV